tara:strand:+ start:67171 stop:67950 length:780 start_codon:yes stop_codon:yes gene_type:complete
MKNFKIFFTIFFLLGILNTLLCQSSSESEENRISNLENQINQLMGIVIPDMQNAMQSMVKSKAQSDSTSILLINRINTLQNTIRILESKATYTDSINFQLLQQLMMIENKIITLTRSFNELYDLKVEPESISSGKYNDDYKSNYIDALSFYNDGKYNEAIQSFASLVLNNPNHKLSDNSQFWLGESYYALKNYKRAIVEFEKVFQFTEEDKWDDAQLKLGICFQKIGNYSRARLEFEKLINHYPGSEYYKRAQQYLRQL